MTEKRKIPQGKILGDRSYEYRCPCYHKPCLWCFNGDLSRIRESFKLSRGQTYYGNLKAYLAIEGKRIIDTAQSIAESEGKFTPMDILKLADEVNFPRNRIKALIEWLEECSFVRPGTGDRLRESPQWKPMTLQWESDRPCP